MKRTDSLLVFGPFQLDTASARLLRGDTPVDVRLRVLEVLRTLIEHQGHFVDYEKLQREAWDGVSVSRHTVAVTMGEVKKALGEYGSWLHCRAKLGYCLGAPQSEELTKMGWHFFNRRTRDGLEKAIECFTESVRVDHEDGRAAEGLCHCYLTLGTLGMHPPREVYPQFLKTLERAAELQGWTAELRSARAQGLHMFERRWAESEREYEGAAAQGPQLASNQMRRALLFTSLGRMEEALDALRAAERADPLWPPLPAAQCSVHFFMRRFDEAVDCGKRALELHPYLHLGRSFYAQALEFSGHIEEALEQYRLACVMTPDLTWLAGLEAAALVRNGLRKEGELALEKLRERRASEYVDAYYMALTLEAFGLRDEAFDELERAYQESATTLSIANVDPRLGTLPLDSRFPAWRDKAFAGSPFSLSSIAVAQSPFDHSLSLAAGH